jgi:hypothetical protein
MPPQAASLASALFRVPFPHMAVSAIRDRVSCTYTFSAGIGLLSVITPISPVTLFRQSCRETRRPLRVIISSENPVTARISMKTIIKPQTSFFPSCIMDLGALASSNIPLAATLPQRSYDSCAGLLRPRLVSNLPFAAPRIFDN